MDAELRLLRLAEAQFGVFTRQEALNFGIAPQTITDRLQQGRWEPLHAGVYRIVGSPATWHQGVMAACKAGGDSALASFRAAGTLWRLEGIKLMVEITIPESQRLHVRGVVVHRAVKPERPRAFTIDGIPVTPIARTLIDLAAVLPVAALADAVGDACAQRVISPGYLKRYLDRLGRRGRRGAGRLNRLLMEQADGPLVAHRGFERRLFRVLVEGGLPTPIPQHPIRVGWSTKYIDFAYPDVLLAIEADSFRWHSGPRGWSRDRVRTVDLVALGWRPLPITWHDLVTRPQWVVEKVRSAREVIEVRRISTASR